MNLRPVIFFRTYEHVSEAAIAARYLPVLENLTQIKSGDLVIGRFSLQPFYDLVAQEIESKGAQLLVSYAGYYFISHLLQWGDLLMGLTPRSWEASQIAEIPDLPHGYFIKGETNSLKHDWQSTYTTDKGLILDLVTRLRSQPLLATQTMVVREFVPLQTYFLTPAGLPITEEYRFFVLDGQVISGGFYWQSYLPSVQAAGFTPDFNRVPVNFLTEVARRLDFLRFFVVDVAITATGEPLVIEINDPGMSGLGGNQAEILYANLAQRLGKPNL
jgi:hypothetical protein